MEILVRLSQETLHFFHDLSRGICYRSSSTPQRMEVLVRDAADDFDIIADGDGTLHMICRSGSGEIVYIVNDSGQWHQQVLLRGRSEQSIASRFKIIRTEEGLRVFYVITYSGEYLLVSHSVPDGQPEVLVKLTEDRFVARRDELGCTYLLFPAAAYGGEYGLLVYRYGSWGAPQPLETRFTVADALFTGHKTGHLALTLNNTLYYAVMRDGAVESPVEVASGGRGFVPALLAYEGSLWMLYEQNGHALYYKAGSPARQSSRIIASGAPHLFRVRIPGGEEYLLCEYCYGQFMQNQASLYIASDLSKKPEPQKLSDTVNIELTKLTLKLESQTQVLHQKISALSAQMARLNERMNALDASAAFSAEQVDYDARVVSSQNADTISVAGTKETSAQEITEEIEKGE